MKKQNLFADMEDFFDGEDGFVAVAIIAGFFMFIGLWIHFDTFWGALFAIALLGPTLGGLAALFVFSVSMMFARREEEIREGGYPRLFRFLLAILPLLFSGSFLYAAFLLFKS